MALVELLRNGTTFKIINNDNSYKNFVKYSKPYDDQWSDKVLLENVINLKCCRLHLKSLPELPKCTYLNCSGNRLKSLPELPKCTKLFCSSNQLKSLPELPNCTVLYCYVNQLESLPELPNCTVLYCNSNQLKSLPGLPNCTYLYCYYNNQLKSLPELPKCINLFCYDNQLENLPELPNCTHLHCSNNPLSFTELSEWKVIWRMRNIYYGKKYFRLWLKRTWQIKVQRKYDLHLELIYSPKLPFYLEDEYCKHFKECQAQYKQPHY
jgi:hypothetical protein